ncbi:hypothetical protein JCM1841_006765 [Sporobolomyces salmonicolor]
MTTREPSTTATSSSTRAAPLPYPSASPSPSASPAPPALPAESAGPIPRTVAKSSKPSKRRRKPLRRRGAKDDSEGEESQGGASGAAGTDSDESDSDFEPGSAPSDESEEEDEDEDEDGALSPKTPVTASIEQLNSSLSGRKASPAPFAKEQDVHPSWSDLPAVGEPGASQLPELEFADLSLEAMAAVRTSSPSAAPATAGMSKKQQLLQRRIQKSEELRARDPAAWEAKEKERKEREEAKRLARKEKAKEKRRERRAAEKAQKAEGGDAAETAALMAAPATDRLIRPVVPARPSRTALAFGLVKPQSDSSLSVPSSSHPAAPPAPSASRPKPAFLSSSRPAPSPRFAAPGMSLSSSSAAPSPDYLRAREAYSARLAADPSYIPKVGKFWGHDDRLASPEVRALNPFWRGRGGGPRGGSRGRGAVRGRMGGVGGADRWDREGTVVEEAAGESMMEKEKEAHEGEEKEGDKEKEKPVAPDSDDDWGRGEAKRPPRLSSVAPMPAWNHTGFEELEREETGRSAMGAAVRGTRGGRGGARGGVGRGGAVFARGGTVQGPPGAINPRYAHLPFHPLHRFPPAPSSASTAPPPPQVSASQKSPAAPEATTTAGEHALFDAAGGSPKAKGVVRLPGSGAGAAQFALAVKGAAAARAKEAGGVNEGSEKENNPPSPSAAQIAAAADVELRKQQGASVLYAADPSRLADSAPEDPAVPAVSLAAYQQQQVAPLPHQASMSYMHQLPPHLQGQPLAQPPPPFIPRHSSPAFYPPPPPHHHGYYSPDAFSSLPMALPSPGATPPPPLFPAPPPSAAFFLPPRSSKIEIKAPSRDGQSPTPSATTTRTTVSTTNTAYAQAQQMQQRQQHESAASSPSSPSQSQLPYPFYPGQAQPPYAPSPTLSSVYGGHSPGSSYDLHAAQAMMDHRQAQDGLVYYHQHPHSLHQYAPHPLSQQQNYGYYAQDPYAAGADPAILSMGGGGGARGGGYYDEQQPGSWGMPPPAPY